MVVAGHGVCCSTACSTRLTRSSRSPVVQRRHVPGPSSSSGNISFLSPLRFLLIFSVLFFFVDGATSTMVAMTQTSRSGSEVAAVPDRDHSVPLRFQTAGLEDNRVDDDELPVEYPFDAEDNYDDGYDDQDDVSNRLQPQQQHRNTNSKGSDSGIGDDSTDYSKHFVDVGSIDAPLNSSGRTTTTVTAADVEFEGERISRLPQAIIIGVKKGGTRALLEFLRVHPDVRAPGPEVHFFDRNYHRGLDWYRSQMPPTAPGQVTVEKTPSYFVTKAAPSRVYNMSRDVRLIVVVRDPVTRAVSDYAQAVTKRPDMPSFDRMAFLDVGGSSSGNLSSDDDGARASGPVATSWGAVKIGVYSRHLERWLRFFPRRQIHFVHGERLVADPAGELADLQDFLGLRRYVTERHFYFNATKGFPCLRKSDVDADEADRDRDDGSDDGAGGSASGKGDAGGPSGVRCLGKNKGRTHPVVDAKVLQRLRDFFRPFNEKFYRQTGIDFGWP